MAHSLLESVLSVLRQDIRLVSEDGELLKNKTQELAYKLDPLLIGLLLKNKLTKSRFFTEIEGYLIFNQDAFVSFVMSKEFLPDSYTQYKNTIGLTVDGKSLNERKEISLVWAYKDCVLAGGQDKEDSKRDEIFYNETLGSDQIDKLLDPKIFTEFRRIDKNGKHDLEKFKKNENGDIKDNLIIKGNNLLALHSLKKKFTGKVKLIYIDPPYNTGTDSFKYNDRFNHSTYLSFMRNRLEIAKELLSVDGVICVHCDYVEDAYLRIVLDEIFNDGKLLNSIAVRDSHPSGLKLSGKESTIIKTKSTILVYSKSQSPKIKPIYQKREDWDTHFNLFVDTKSKKLEKLSLKDFLVSKSIIDEKYKIDENLLKDSKIRKFIFENKENIFQSTKEIPEHGKELSLNNPDKVVMYSDGEYALNGRRLSPFSKSFYNVGIDGEENFYFGKLICDFWDDVDFNNSQNEGGVGLPAGKKPELLMGRILTMFSNKNDIVLDFFGGSGTTGAVAHKMGRQYILTEQMDYIHDLPEARLVNVINGDDTGISESVDWKGGGDVVYMEIACDAENYIQMIRLSKDIDSLLKIWEDMKTKSFINYKLDPKSIDNTLDEFKKLSFEDQKKTLIDLIDKNALYKNFSDMEDAESGVSENDKRLNQDFYNS